MSKKSIKQFNAKITAPKKPVKNNKRKVAEWVLAILILIWTIGTVLGVVGFVRTLPKASAEETQSSMQLMDNKKSFTYPTSTAGGYFSLPMFNTLHLYYSNSSNTVNGWADIGGRFNPFFQFYRKSTDTDYGGALGLRMQTNPYNSLYNSYLEVPYAIGTDDEGNGVSSYITHQSTDWMGYSRTYLINFYGGTQLHNIDFDLNKIYAKECSIYLNGDVLYGNSLFGNGASQRGIRYVIDFAYRDTHQVITQVSINICFSTLYTVVNNGSANVVGIVNKAVFDSINTQYNYPTSNTANYAITSFTSDTYRLGDVSNFTYWQSYASIYDDGYDAGVSDGYELGDADGYTFGYNDGYNAGKADGFTDGVANANEYSFAGLLGAVFDVPVQTFQGLFNFEILGVNLSGFFLALLTLMIILAITKLFI